MKKIIIGILVIGILCSVACSENLTSEKKKDYQPYDPVGRFQMVAMSKNDVMVLDTITGELWVAGAYSKDGEAQLGIIYAGRVERPKSESIRPLEK